MKDRKKEQEKQKTHSHFSSDLDHASMMDQPDLWSSQKTTSKIHELSTRKHQEKPVDFSKTCFLNRPYPQKNKPPEAGHNPKILKDWPSTSQGDGHTEAVRVEYDPKEAPAQPAFAGWLYDPSRKEFGLLDIFGVAFLRQIFSSRRVFKPLS